jgi:anti-anti-sigma factor
MNQKPPFSAVQAPDQDQEPNVQIWHLTGKMLGGTCCYDFLDTVRENIVKGRTHPILDLSDISLANSTGIGVLASIYNAAEGAGGYLVLSGANDRVRSVLQIVNLWNMVKTFDSLEEARNHVAGK